MLNWHHDPGPEPTLVFLPAFPFSNEMYRPVIEPSQYEFIDGGGHLTPVEAPEEFSQLVRLFLKEFNLENNNQDVETTSEQEKICAKNLTL